MLYVTQEYWYKILENALHYNFMSDSGFKRGLCVSRMFQLSYTSYCCYHITKYYVLYINIKEYNKQVINDYELFWIQYIYIYIYIYISIIIMIMHYYIANKLWW